MVMGVWLTAAAELVAMVTVLTWYSDVPVTPVLLLMTDCHHVTFPGMTYVLKVVLACHVVTSWPLVFLTWCSLLAVVFCVLVVQWRSPVVVVCWQSCVEG